MKNTTHLKYTNCRPQTDCKLCNGNCQTFVRNSDSGERSNMSQSIVVTLSFDFIFSIFSPFLDVTHEVCAIRCHIRHKQIRRWMFPRCSVVVTVRTSLADWLTMRDYAVNNSISRLRSSRQLNFGWWDDGRCRRNGKKRNGKFTFCVRCVSFG